MWTEAVSPWFTCLRAITFMHTSACVQTKVHQVISSHEGKKCTVLEQLALDS